MLIFYTIRNDRFELNAPSDRSMRDSRFAESAGSLTMGIQNPAGSAFSLLNVHGRTPADIEIRFNPSAAKGVLACFQVVENSGCLSFSSEKSVALNYSPRIVDVRLIQTNIPFEHRYALGSQVRRIDLFLTEPEAEKMFNQALLTELHDHHLVTLRNERDAERDRKALEKIERLLDASQASLQQDDLDKFASELVSSINEFCRKKKP